MADHRVNYKSYLNGSPKYMSSYEILQYTDHYIELLFEGEFESVDMFRKKEGDYIRDLKCVNKRIAGRTAQEHYEDNKEYFVEKTNQYYKEHKTHILEKHKIKFTCACGSIICKNEKSRHERSQKHKRLMLCLSAAKSCVEVHFSSCQAAENCGAEMLSLGAIS